MEIADSKEYENWTPQELNAFIYDMLKFVGKVHTILIDKQEGED